MQRRARGETGDSGTILFPEMEPVPRPQWASPIEVGVHARSFYSALPEVVNGRRTPVVQVRAVRESPKALDRRGELEGPPWSAESRGIFLRNVRGVPLRRRTCGQRPAGLRYG